MKSLNNSNRQSGFFDLGMSLIVIAIAGGVVYGVESSHAEQIAASQPGMAVEQAAQPVMAEVSANPTADAGTVPQ